MWIRALAIGCVLLLAGAAAARPKQAGKNGDKKGAAVLVVSYEVTNDADSLHEVWFVDGEGRAFSFRRNGGRDPLAEAERAGGLTSRDVAALVAESRPLPNPIAAADLDRARALLPAAQHSMVWAHRRRDPCKFGVTIAIHGYRFSPGRAAEVIPLRETTCGWSVDENLAPEAQELIDWVYRVSGIPRPRLRR